MNDISKKPLKQLTKNEIRILFFTVYLSSKSSC